MRELLAPNWFSLLNSSGKRKKEGSFALHGLWQLRRHVRNLALMGSFILT